MLHGYKTGSIATIIWEEVREIDNPAVKESEALTTAGGGNFVRAEVI